MADEIAEYPTRYVKMWFMSDADTYQAMRELARSAADENAAGDALREHVEDNNPLAEHASVYTDLLRWAIERVNFAALAATLRREE